MTQEQFKIVYPLVYKWINDLLLDASAQARTVASIGFKRLPSYFSQDLLSSSKFIIVDRIPMPPLSAMGLDQFSDFEQGDYDGVTYLDSFFVRNHRSGDERLFFHELIHVIQWKLLGPERFIAMYADGLEKYGYRNSPLEVMAYTAEDRFVRLVDLFDAEKYVKMNLV